MKIFLIGYMGAGKSYWGNMLAEYWTISFIDIDAKIVEQEKLSIVDIFQQKGEIYFRQIEHTILQQYIQGNKSFVMACGGGTPCFYDNINIMKKHGVVVWINPSQKILFNRLQQKQNNRPLIQHLSKEALKSLINQQLAEREKYYNQAHIIINNDDINIEQLVKQIQYV